MRLLMEERPWNKRIQLPQPYCADLERDPENKIQFFCPGLSQLFRSSESHAAILTAGEAALTLPDVWRNIFRVVCCSAALFFFLTFWASFITWGQICAPDVEPCEIPGNTSYLRRPVHHHRRHHPMYGISPFPVRNSRSGWPVERQGGWVGGWGVGIQKRTKRRHSCLNYFIF